MPELTVPDPTADDLAAVVHVEGEELFEAQVVLEQDRRSRDRATQLARRPSTSGLNCAASVEPASADVEDLPFDTAWDTASK